MIKLFQFDPAAGERGRENGSFPVAEAAQRWNRWVPKSRAKRGEAGGAMLDFLAGKELPGIKALEI